MGYIDIDKLSNEKMKEIGFKGYALSTLHVIIYFAILIGACAILFSNIFLEFSVPKLMIAILLILLLPVTNFFWSKAMIDIMNEKKIHFLKNIGYSVKNIFRIWGAKIIQLLKGKKGNMLIITGICIIAVVFLVVIGSVLFTIFSFGMIPLMTGFPDLVTHIMNNGFFYLIFSLLLIVAGIIFKAKKLESKYCMLNYTMHYNNNLKSPSAIIKRVKEDSEILFDEAKAINLKYFIIFLITNFVIGTVMALINTYILKLDNEILIIFTDIFSGLIDLGIIVYITIKVFVSKNELYKNLILNKKMVDNSNLVSNEDNN